jgi:hypothetical protein
MRHQQLITNLAPDGRGFALAISCSKQLEHGSRATLMLAERLFRIDVVPALDSLRTIVRNLSSGELELLPSHHTVPGTNAASGDAVRYEPARAEMGFRLRTAAETIAVSVTIGTVRLVEHGVTRISAQAIIRQLGPDEAVPAA